jgi:hypothetical protein
VEGDGRVVGLERAVPAVVAALCSRFWLGDVGDTVTDNDRDGIAKSSKWFEGSRTTPIEVGLSFGGTMGGEGNASKRGESGVAGPSFDVNDVKEDLGLVLWPSDDVSNSSSSSRSFEATTVEGDERQESPVTSFSAIAQRHSDMGQAL